MSIKSLLLAAAITGLSMTAAYADVAIINTTQDATINGYSNNYWNYEYRWVGAPTYYSIFQFDVGSYKDATINSVSFSAYHNYNAGDSYLGAALGLSNDWNSQTVIQYPGFGSALDSQYETSGNVGTYQTWNLGSLDLSGGLLTVALFDQGYGWNDYESVISPSGHPAYLTVNYSEVPEPAAVALFGAGLLGFAASRRKSAKNA